MKTLQEIVEDYIICARDDRADIGLWAIAQSVKEDMDVKSEAEIKSHTLLIVRKLMEQNIMPGNLAENGGFDFWRGSRSELLARIEAEWPKQGIPRLDYNGCWLALKKA